MAVALYRHPEETLLLPLMPKGVEHILNAPG